MSEDDAIIMLIPIFIGDEDGSVVPGSAKIKADCGHECYISQSSLRMINDAQHSSYTTRCAGCLTDEDIKGIAMAQLAPGAEQEMNLPDGHLGIAMILLAMTNGLRDWHLAIKARMQEKGLISP